ncbi:hypothetical protein F4860DRAFT_244030 [Xylaria cubensis]|nr:hypothetical protein F4860DRAFT_244030 [Xylaria cubensis]
MGENRNETIEKFWDVFIEDIPRVPTVDELICRIVSINYPRGIVTDINGATFHPPVDTETVSKQILDTIKRAIELEKDFWIKQLRRNHHYTPYSWGVRLSSNIAITEAERMINEALKMGNIDQLDSLFWNAYRRTEILCEQDCVQLTWPPFQRKVVACCPPRVTSCVTEGSFYGSEDACNLDFSHK